ncbi:MAG: N-6 DNA methylase [Acidimicrobiales bacterium]|nr:N-6 DNA methylase [Acidimicrobiales bacterium]
MSGSTTSGVRAALSAGVPAEVVLASVVAGSGGPAFIVDGAVIGPVTLDQPIDLVGDDGLGRIYEGLLGSDDRRSLGAFYTPSEVAAGLVAQVVTGGTVVDPACGGGAFLLAAARRLLDLGVGSREEIVVERLFGADIDPVAVAVCRWSLASWAGISSDEVTGVVVGDSLSDGVAVWNGSPVGGFDAVVGNPPFLGQLREGTARDPVEREVLKERFAGLVGAYTDTAWLFLALGLDLLAEGARMVLIQPQSVLAARDAAPVRSHLLDRGFLDALWFDRSGVFSGRAEVCAPIVERGSGNRSVRLLVDREVVPAGEVEAPGAGLRWGGLVVGLVGIPRVDLAGPDRGVRRVCDVAATTAGFRQHYYGLVPAVREHRGESDKAARLVTTGLVDPLRCHWSQREARFARRVWIAPVVDTDLVSAEDPVVGAWIEARLCPKLLVATQTRVMEVVVDLDGDMVPVTPLVIVEPDEDDLWRLAAALSAPPVSALAAGQTLGAARASDRIKLSAGQVGEMPLPADSGAWSEGAALARRLWESPGSGGPEAWLAFGSVMCEAYGVANTAILEWWWDRHPERV